MARSYDHELTLFGAQGDPSGEGKPFTGSCSTYAAATTCDKNERPFEPPTR
jgi:hypothetical protein